MLFVVVVLSIIMIIVERLQCSMINTIPVDSSSPRDVGSGETISPNRT